MEKKTIVKLASAALVLCSLASCNEELDIIAENSKDVEKRESMQALVDEYTRGFEERYGKIDPNHNWGFGDIVGNPGTRAQVAEKNEWVDKYHMQVPGWPDVWMDENGKMHNDKYHNNANGNNTYDDAIGNEPAGDVTDEEIQYVSWWFRTHRYPSSLNVHWSDFYIQEVSSDNDRDANGYKITEVAEFAKQTDGSWIHSGTETINEFTIDQLKVKTMESNDNDLTTYDHINNFNSGASNTLFGTNQLSMGTTYNWPKMDTDVATPKRMIAYYQTSGTEDWAAHYSNDEQWRSNYLDRNIWVMVHLHFIGKSGRVYDGYYLGFDYAYHKVWSDKYQIRKPDGYYSNWILKVSPGVPLLPEQNGFSRRIMCEDLGNTHDLDFDDVVFDVTINMTQTELENYKNSNSTDNVDATVTLMAAGGTMPLWVGRKEDAYEAHALFNQSTTTPVNVANGVDAPIVNYHITMNSVNFDDVQIWVQNTVLGELMLPNAVQPAVGNHSTPAYQVNSEKKAPQKFAVPTNVLWLKETRQIETAYPLFAEWVKDSERYAVDTEEAWYLKTEGGNLDNLCGMAAEVPFDKAPTPGQINNSGLVGTTSSFVAFKHYDVFPFANDKSWGTVEVIYNSERVSSDDTNATLTVAAGTTVTLKATPAVGYHFVRWDNNTENADITNATVVDGVATANVTVNNMRYIMGYFAPDAGVKKVKVTFVDGPGLKHTLQKGSKLGDQELFDIENNEYYDVQLNLNIQKDNGFDQGYTFDGWFVNDVKISENPNCEVKISDNDYNSDLTIEARTSPKQ